MPTRFSFEEESHTYWLNGRRIPSVTDILEPLQELEGIPQVELERARKRGQLGHHAIHMMINNVLDWRSLDPQLVGFVEAAKKFIVECEVQVLVSEHRMCDEGLRIAGTLDLLALMRQKKHTAIVDWKLVATMSRTAALQTAGYEQMYRRTMGGATRPMRRYACQLFDDGSYKLFPFEDPRDYTWFNSAANIWHWKNAA